MSDKRGCSCTTAVLVWQAEALTGALCAAFLSPFSQVTIDQLSRNDSWIALGYTGTEMLISCGRVVILNHVRNGLVSVGPIY